MKEQKNSRSLRQACLDMGKLSGINEASMIRLYESFRNSGLVESSGRGANKQEFELSDMAIILIGFFGSDNVSGAIKAFQRYANLSQPDFTFERLPEKIEEPFPQIDSFEEKHWRIWNPWHMPTLSWCVYYALLNIDWHVKDKHLDDFTFIHDWPEVWVNFAGKRYEFNKSGLLENKPNWYELMVRREIVVPGDLFAEIHHWKFGDSYEEYHKKLARERIALNEKDESELSKLYQRQQFTRSMLGYPALGLGDSSLTKQTESKEATTPCQE